MRLQLLTPATVMPIATSDLRRHARASSSDDLLLTSALRSALGFIERETWKPIIAKRYVQTFDTFFQDECGKLVLSRSPILKVESVKYVDVDGVTQTVSSSEWTMYHSPRPTILPAYNMSWPAARPVRDSVIVTFRSGFLEPITVVDINADTFSYGGDWIENGSLVHFYAREDATLPSGVTAGQDFYAVNVASGTFQVSATSGGAAIDLGGTPVAAGLFVTQDEFPEPLIEAMRLIVTGAYEMREPSITGTISSPNPYWASVEALVFPYKTPRF